MTSTLHCPRGRSNFGFIAAAMAVLAMSGCTLDSSDDAAPAPGVVVMKVLSSSESRVTDGSALIELQLPAGAAAADVRVTQGGNDVTTAFTAAIDGKTLRGVVRGMPLGRVMVAADIGAKNGNAAAHGEVLLTVSPRTGPVFSGAKLTPFECRTVESGLGSPTDTSCSVNTQYEWHYFTAAGTRRSLADPLGTRPADVASTTTLDGKTVPFIVRVESGTINRSIYRIAVLDDPKTTGVWNGAGWNQRVVFRFGESTAAQYNQGTLPLSEVFKADAIDTQSISAMGRGFAYVVSSLNINKVNVNDVLAAETAMMLREHISKNYGLPKWMVGMGGSGGAIQQMLIAQNYPGVLDGVMPDAAFPDVFSTALAVADCRLLNRYFAANPAADAVRKAFEGHLKNTCANWDAGNGDAVLATSGSVSPACGLNDQSKVYNATANSTGARCTVYDININTLGRNVATNAANRPLDNVGVQYGLDALKKGSITTTQFLDLNARIGGFDADGNLVTNRTVADALGLSRAYEMGRIGSGGGGLATTPIMHMRAYAEPAGDIHTIYNDIKIREQLLRANGRADNQVIWLLPNPALASLLGLGTAQRVVLAGVLKDTFLARLTLMTKWLDDLAADTAPLSAAKVARLKPADATDSCWGVADAKRYVEVATLNGAGTCNTLYPRTLPPRMQAGAPATDDVVKCQLKPVADADYAPATFTAADRTRLATVFPDGVCDYSKSGVGQTGVKGTWLTY